jgi:hypothetical protein
MDQRPGPTTPAQAVLMMRIIGLSLGTGVTLFAAVSWFLHRQGGALTADIDPTVAFNGFLGMLLLGALGAIFVWRWRVAPVIERPTQEGEWRARAATLQTGVILTWALLEGAALVGEVVYFLTGHGLAGVLGVALIWVGIGLTWPKREWIEGPAAP